MRAVHITHRGEPEEAVETVRVDKPDPEPNEVRIQVAACALNHKDVFARTGHPNHEADFPIRTGTDIAGTVDAVGGEVHDLTIGDRVTVYPKIYCGECEWCLRGEQSMCADVIGIGGSDGVAGGLAEYVTLPAKVVESIGDALDFDTAAAFPVTFTTAWRMIVTAGQLRPAESALILGASGGVGNAALQIADMVGADLYATTSTDAKARRIRHWADHVIDYTEVAFDERIEALTDGRGVDLVADHVGATTWQTSINSLAKTGRMVICGATSGPDPDIDIRSVYQPHRRIVGAPLGNRREFRNAKQAIESGDLEPQIDRVLALDEVVEGHRALENRDVFGKVIVRTQE